jgi:hypothetical protein
MVCPQDASTHGTEIVQVHLNVRVQRRIVCVKFEDLCPAFVETGRLVHLQGDIWCSSLAPTEAVLALLHHAHAASHREGGADHIASGRKATQAIASLIVGNSFILAHQKPRSQIRLHRHQQRLIGYPQVFTLPSGLGADGHADRRASVAKAHLARYDSAMVQH